MTTPKDKLAAGTETPRVAFFHFARNEEATPLRANAEKTNAQSFVSCINDQESSSYAGPLNFESVIYKTGEAPKRPPISRF